MGDDNYRKLLERADEHFASVMKAQPQNMQCGAGCSLCCHGLFEIGSGDVPLIAAGLEQLQPARRKKVVARAQAIVEESAHPNLRECSAGAKARFFERTRATACPNLDEAGHCVMYEHRPLVCRTFGVPLRDGSKLLDDVCELNFTSATRDEQMRAAWDLGHEDVLGPEDEFTIPEVIVMVARMRGWSSD